MAVIQQFRTAMRGFNRQDVQGYIEQMAATHRQELAELQKKLDESDSRVRELEEAVSGMNALQGEVSKVQAALEESNQTAGRLRGELSQAGSKLSVAKKEMERLQARIDALEPMAAGYQKLRDRAASVELDAHQKAQAAVGEAKAEAERIRADARKWLGCVMAEYSQLRAGLDGVLERLQALDGVPERAKALDETAALLRELGGLK